MPLFIFTIPIEINIIEINIQLAFAIEQMSLSVLVGNVQHIAERSWHKYGLHILKLNNSYYSRIIAINVNNFNIKKGSNCA